MDDPWKRAPFIPALVYADPPAAVAWLQKAFGFELTMAITGSDVTMGHWEMAFEGGVIMLGGVWNASFASPATVKVNTQTVHVHLRGGLDAHYKRARAAGAVIVLGPQEQFYGDRTYACLDLEGHRWTFGQTTRYVSREEAERVSGLKIEGWAEL